MGPDGRFRLCILQEVCEGPYDLQDQAGDSAGRDGSSVLGLLRPGPQEEWLLPTPPHLFFEEVRGPKGWGGSPRPLSRDPGLVSLTPKRGP